MNDKDREKLIAEAKAQGMTQAQAEAYINDIVTRQVARTNAVLARFEKEVKALGLDDDQAEVFKSMVASTSPVKDDGTPRSDEERWEEARERAKKVFKKDDTKPADTQVKPEGDTPDAKPDVAKVAPNGYSNADTLPIDNNTVDLKEKAPWGTDDDYFEALASLHRKSQTLVDRRAAGQPR